MVSAADSNPISTTSYGVPSRPQCAPRVRSSAYRAGEDAAKSCERKVRELRPVSGEMGLVAASSETIHQTLDRFFAAPDWADALAVTKALGWLVMTEGDLPRARRFAEQQGDGISETGWTGAAAACEQRGMEVVR